MDIEEVDALRRKDGEQDANLTRIYPELGSGVGSVTLILVKSRKVESDFERIGIGFSTEKYLVEGRSAERNTTSVRVIHRRNFSTSTVGFIILVIKKVAIKSLACAEPIKST